MLLQVTAAIIEKDGKFLAARKRKGLELAGLWEFPGGKIEPGETAENCLKRELAEEFGIDCRIGDFLAESIHCSGNRTIRLLGYHACHTGGDFRLTDHDAICWLPIEKLLDLTWAPADIPLVRELQALRGEEATQAYYQHHAAAYAQATLDADMEEIRHSFLKLLPQGSHILDVGCGSGRDSRSFLNRGHQVTAIEPVPALARLATNIIGRSVLEKKAQEVDEIEQYDGIWACASLVHLPSASLAKALSQLVQALKPKGILYLSFPLDRREGFDELGRYFNGLSLQSMQAVLDTTRQLTLVAVTETTANSPQPAQRWLNLYCRRQADE